MADILWGHKLAGRPNYLASSSSGQYVDLAHALQDALQHLSLTKATQFSPEAVAQHLRTLPIHMPWLARCSCSAKCGASKPCPSIPTAIHWNLLETTKPWVSFTTMKVR